MHKVASQTQDQTTSTLLPVSGILQRKCACGNQTVAGGECEECSNKRTNLQRRAVNNQSEHSEAPPIVHEVLRSTGQPLDVVTRAFMEQRFGHDFSGVRIHADGKAAESAWAVNALAYTVGRNVVFGTGQYAPGTAAGKRLLAHELTHVAQQANGSSSSVGVESLAIGADNDEFEREAASAAARVCLPGESAGPERVQVRGLPSVQRLPPGMPVDDMRVHKPGAPKAVNCSIPSDCPTGFCDAFSSESFALTQRTKLHPLLMAGIAAAVDSRVVPLWAEHLNGGSSTKDLTKQFAGDFMLSRTTQATTAFLMEELEKSLKASPPTFPPGKSAVILDLATQIGTAIAEINTPGGNHEMNFNYPKEVPGNLAGGIGADQQTCKAGAKPSPFNDSREVRGTVTVVKGGSGDLSVFPNVTYTVKDTIDLCPGNCGTRLERIATVPISQFEATGISGDVPFIVEFPALPTVLTIPGPASPGAPSGTVPAPAPKTP